MGKKNLSCSFYLYRFRKYVSYGFPIITFCNPGVHYETPCIFMLPYRVLINLELTSSNILGFCPLSNVEQSRKNTTFWTPAPSTKYPKQSAPYTHTHTNTHYTCTNTSNTDTGGTIRSVSFSKLLSPSSAQILQLCTALSKNESSILYVG